MAPYPNSTASQPAASKSTTTPTTAATGPKLPTEGRDIITPSSITANPNPLEKMNTLAPDSSSTATPPADIPIPAGASNPHLLTILARYQAEAGQLTSAQQTLKQIDEWSNSHASSLSATQLDTFNSNRVETIAVLASQQYKQQLFATAQELWLQAINLTNTLKAPSERALAFASLARSLHDSNPIAAGSYFKRAEENARIINDPTLRATTLSALARDLAATDHSEQSRELFAQAKTTVVGLPNTPTRLVALSVVAQHFAEAGDTAVANTLLQEIDSAKIAAPPLAVIQHRLQTQGAIARNFARTGDPLTARTQLTATLGSAETLNQSDTQDDILLYLAQTLARMGDLQSADKIVTKLMKKYGISANPVKAPL